MPIMQQAQGGALIAGQYAHPSLVLYPSNPLLARGGYIPAVSMPGHANAARKSELYFLPKSDLHFLQTYLLIHVDNVTLEDHSHPQSTR